MISTNRRERMNRRQVSRHMIETMMHDYENAMLAKFAEMSAENVKLSPERQMINERIQKYSKAKGQAINSLAEYINDLVSVVETMAKEELQVGNRIRKNGEYQHVQFSQIENFVNQCMPLINELRELSRIEKVQIRNGRPIYTNYERLFLHLTKIDVRFATFAPLSLIEAPTYAKQFEHMQEASKLKLDAYIADLKKQGAEDYAELYYKNEFDPDLPIGKKVNKVLAELDLQEQRCIDTIVDSVRMFAVDICGFLEEEMTQVVENGEKFDGKKADSLFALTSHARAVLVAESNRPAVENQLNFEGYNPHKEFLINSIKLNGNFLVSIIKEYIKRNKTTESSKKLTLKEKQDLFEILEENKIFDNPKFVSLKGEFEELFEELGVENLL